MSDDIKKRLRCTYGDELLQQDALHHIERLEQEIERLHQHRKIVIEDMREFDRTYHWQWPTSPSEFIDAYCKDRGIE